MLLAEVDEQLPPDAATPAPTAEAAQDAALVERFRAGEAGAFDAIVARHRPRVTRLSHRLLGWGGGADVEDVVQDVFLAAFESLHRFRGQSALATWLTSVTLNRCRRHRRGWAARWRRLRRFAGRSEAIEPADRPAERDDVVERVRAAVRQLSPADREVVVLYHLQGHAVAEVCELLGATKGAVEVRLHRARRRLKDMLTELGDE